MSFGWSAGDISQAISIIVKAARALDDASGAAANYREAVEFLRSLKHILEILRTATALDSHPSYQEEIRQNVQDIKQPLEKFLADVNGFEPSLGAKAPAGFHHNMGKKLRWRFVTSKRVIGLRREIEDRMRVLDSLLQLLTIDLLVDIQSKVGDGVRTAISDVLDSRVLPTIQQHLHAFHTALVDNNYHQKQRPPNLLSRVEDETEILNPTHKVALDQQNDALLAVIRGNDDSLAKDVKTLKDHVQMANSTIQSDSFSKSSVDISNTQRVSNIHSSLTPPLREFQGAGILLANNLQQSFCEFKELLHACFLLLTALLHLGRNIILQLARTFRPMVALTPTLIAKYHISFYDAIGRPPKVLDYDCFKNYDLFETYLKAIFSDTPGATWVEQGLYQLANSRNGSTIGPQSWSSKISPGTHINMAMLLEQNYGVKLGGKCPKAKCLGILKVHLRGGLMSCDINIWQELSSASSEPIERGNISQRIDGMVGASRRNSQSRDVTKGDVSLGIDFNDVIHFKRIVLIRPPTIPLPAPSTGHASKKQPLVNFLFSINNLPLNDKISDGGVAPRCDDNGRWLPPHWRAGFGLQTSAALPLYRWQNGIVSPANGYQVYNGQWWGPRRAKAAAFYRTSTMFYCQAFDYFLATEGDASARDMETSDFPHDRWYTLNFRHHETLSRLDLFGPERYLAGNGPRFIDQLGLTSWSNPDPEALPSGGLAGNLALLIALIAFSCRSQHLSDVLQNSWRDYSWRGHNHGSGRRERRGLVVSIYLDPENPQSTEQAISGLEWSGGPILL